MRSESLLDQDRGGFHLEEASSVVPASDAPLQDEDLSREHPVPLLLEVEVVSVLEEDLGPSKLVVRLAQHCGADLGSRLPAVHLVGRWAPVDQVPVPLGELHEGVPDRVAGPSDPDRLHHARVAQLAAAQLSVEHLGADDD